MSGTDRPSSAGVSSRTGVKSTCHPKQRTPSMHARRRSQTLTLGYGARSREKNDALCHVTGVSRLVSSRLDIADAGFCYDSGVYRYYEWLTKGKDKLPHFIRQHDPKRPLWLGGLWDCVTLEGTSSQAAETASHCR
jgi:hypothetical protein